MSTAVDTNVLIDLLAGDPESSGAARRSLEAAAQVGALILCPVVYAELLAYPRASRDEVDAFLAATGIAVAWELGRQVWLAAGTAFAAYTARRRSCRDAGPPRRLLADFLIGAHALEAGAFITRDLGIYRACFPELRLIAPV